MNNTTSDRMIQAGIDELVGWENDADTKRDAVDRIYRAMRDVDVAETEEILRDIFGPTESA